MEQMRKEFETWCEEKGHPTNCVIYENTRIYANGHTRVAWQAWQASRAGLVVELPASVYRANEYHIEYTGEVVKEYDEYYEIEDIKNALEQAGVRLK